MILVDKKVLFLTILMLLGQRFSLLAQCNLIEKHPTEQSDCSGNSLNFSVTVFPSAGTSTYQWQNKLPNQNSFTNIPLATNPKYTLTNVGSQSAPDGTQFQCIVTNSNCSQTSTIANLSVNAILKNFTANTTFCEGSNALFELNSTDLKGKTKEITWQKRVESSGAWQDINVGNQLIINKITAANEMFYRAKVTFLNADQSTCIRYTSTTNEHKITVASKQKAMVNYTASCLGTPTQIQMNSCPSPYLGQWLQAKNGTIEILAKGNSYTFTTTALTTKLYYDCTLNGVSCQSLDSISINNLPSPKATELVYSDPLLFCEGKSVLFSIKDKDPKLSYTWFDKSTADTLRVNKSALVSVQAKDANGCFSLQNEQKETIRQERPAKPVILRPNYYTLAVKSPKPDLFYTWKNYKSETIGVLPQLEVKNGGKYYVIASKNEFDLKDDCASKEAEFSIPLQENIGVFRAYANPVKDGIVKIELKNTNPKSPITLSLLSKNGEEIINQIINNPTPAVSINVANLSSGSYLLKVSIDSKSYYSTLVIIN
jgi:hypothetical protein